MKDDGNGDKPERAAPKVSAGASKSLVLVARKLAKIPGRADLALFAAQAGWKAFDASWDSDNGSPPVEALEADVVAIVLAGSVPQIDGAGLDALFLRQGFRVATVPAAYEPEGVGEPASWVSAATTFPTEKPPLPDGAALCFGEFIPTQVLQALEPVP